MARAEDFAQHSFDYLIVGGGTAGLALARRLSDRADLTVGVIEAGPAAWDEPAINIPGRYGETIGTKYDWQFETVAQPGLAGRRVSCPRGKVLGGTSAMNFMAWNRGNREDYDAWEELGNKGWGWDDLLPFFQRSETFHPPDASHQEMYHSYYQEGVHGAAGPVQTTHIRDYGPSHQFWHATLNQLGVSSSPDSLAGSNTGCWNMVCTLDPNTQSRSYSANAYYRPVSERLNLVVLSEATVAEVIIEQDEDGSWAAQGVRFRCDGQTATVRAASEVILAAGSIQSPQLLELSGIGNREVLEAAGVPVKIDNPNVGENLQDHLMMANIYEVQPSLATRDDILSDPTLRQAADGEYERAQKGPWAILPCSMAYCPVSTFASADEMENLRSRAEMVTRETAQKRDEILARQFHPDARLGQMEYLFDLGNWSPFFASEPGKKYGTMLQMLQYPFSRGSVHLPRQATVDDQPSIDPRFYLGPGEIDLSIMRMAQGFADRICATQPLASIVGSRVFPATVAAGEDDDSVVNSTITDWHPIGTCAMGGVVNERLQVYGVRGLRVVDASVMPLQVSAHIQATVYAIAEKGAAMVLEDAHRGPRAQV